jgi:outer membrane autotransporter protein
MKAILGERQHRVLRGGRMTKWKGRAASMSPMLGQLVGSVSPLALALGAAITVSGGGAAAQDICTAAGGGVYNCAGPSTTEQALSVGSGSLTVNLDDTATVDAATGDGFDLLNSGSDGGLTFTQATGGGAITGASDGISARNYGTGALAITATGTVTGGAYGINTSHSGDGALAITATGTVTGGAYGINTRRSGDGALSVTASGTVTGGQRGITARHYGDGALSVAASGTVTGTASDGIAARNTDNAEGGVAVNANVVTGGDEGIYADNNGTGALTVTATGAVTGQSGDGIRADSGGFDFYTYSVTGTDLTIDVTEVSGGNYGVRASNQGSGALTVTATGAVTGQGSDGIRATNGYLFSRTGTDLTIDVEGVSGGDRGIYAFNAGSGALTITAGGDVTGEGRDGIWALNGGYFGPPNGTDLTIETAGVTGAEDGIYARNYATGALSITTAGAVTGQAGSGIRAQNGRYGYGTDLSITAGGDISGGASGIHADNNGTGALTIIASGAVSGAYGDGIEARNNGTDLTIEATDVSGQFYGIDADNDGTGALTITANGAVTRHLRKQSRHRSDNRSDRRVRGGMRHQCAQLWQRCADDHGHRRRDRDIFYRHLCKQRRHRSDDRSQRSVGTRNDGIAATNLGTGALTITATGAVTGQEYDGIRARIGTTTAGAGTDLTVTAEATVSGGDDGIEAISLGTGALTITAADTVTGASGNGIYASNGNYYGGAGTDLTIDAEAGVSGGEGGIGALNGGTGTLTITAAGAVTGTTGAGIGAFNRGTDLRVTAESDVSGGIAGIFARNDGTGALTITANAAVEGTGDAGYGYGIGATAASTAAGDVTVTARGDVTGAREAILVDNQGGGATVVRAEGTLTGGGGYAALAASSAASGTDMTIEVLDATGSIGIDANHLGTGELTVTATGTVTGTAGDGINASNTTNATDGGVTVNANVVTGGDEGIYADNNGTGALTVTATGAVTGQSGDGIRADSGGFDIETYSVTGTYLTIDVAEVTGGQDGIDADNDGTGALTVTATGAVTGQSGDGIRAYSGGFNSYTSSVTGTDLTIDVTEVTGGYYGVRASNRGSGALTISASGAVTGQQNDGIRATNGDYFAGAGTDLTIEVEGVSGGASGIYAFNAGNGALAITATGAVTGTTGDGINAFNSERGTDLSVTAESTVSGGAGGVIASNFGTGALEVTTEAVEGTVGQGIGAYAASRAEGGVTVTAGGDVTGTFNGIGAENNGSGALAITAEGTVTATTGDGIVGRNFGTNLSVTAGAAVLGGDDGIYARNEGTGALEITAAGTVTGTRFDGIQATNEGTDLTIAAGGDVTGGMNGIVTDHRGTGALGVTMAGAVTGGTGAGVENAVTSQGGQFVLQDGGSMQAESGLAFADLADGSTGDASSTLDIAGALNGDVQMGAGGDTLILRDTATLGAGITLDGDAGAENGIAGQIDRLEFAGWTGSFDAVQALNWESVVLSENAVVTFAEGSAAGTAAGGLTVEIGADATARLAGDFTLDGALANGGLLDLSTAAPSVGTQLRVTGDYSAASDLLIDADLSSGGGTDNTVEGDAAFTDQILIGGNVTGTTTVTVNNTGDGLALTDLDGNGQVDANEGLLFAQAQGSAAADSFVLAEPIIDGAFMAEVYSFGPDASVSGAWDYVLGTVFSPATPGYESLPYTLMGFARARSLASRQGGQQWLVGGAPAGGNGSPETAGGGGARDPGLALAPRRGIWIAAEGSRWDVTPQQSTTGLDFDLDLWRIRAGFETIAMEAASGTMTVGLDFFAGNGTLDAHAEAGSTSTSTDAYGGGLTLTWYGDDGLYADGQLSFVSSDSDISSGTLGTVATGVGGSATVLSVELGKRFGLQSGWTVIPQGQLSWASMSFDSFTGSSGETVTPEDWNSLLLRLGAAAERRWQVESGGQASFYGLANVNHEFNADTTVDVSGTKLTSKLPDWTAELGIGGAYDWNDGRGRLFGEVTVSEALGSGDLSGISGTLGFSLRF